jgi:hypothetical protein
MATLTGTKPRNTYKDLLQVSNSNSGIDGTLRSVEDGEGTTGPFKVSTSGVEMSQQLDLNGKELILDADGDTSITADTDDQIDIRIAGADDFAFKANSFEVQTGSKIDLNGTELILDADQDTTIAADTDDQIDIRIAGADDFQFTPNTFTAATGSVVALPDASVSAPALTNTGDTNTGLYFPAADTVGVVAGGTELWRFGSNPTTGRNLIINGNAKISQRNADVTGIGASTVKTPVDMWQIVASTEGRVTASQATSGGSGAIKQHPTAIKLDCTTADGTVGAANIMSLRTSIEANQLQHLRWGDSTAQDVTLSFWMSSPKTGTHCVTLYNADAGRYYIKEFSVASQNTWEKFEITYPGDTGGSFNNDSGAGLRIDFPLQAGSNEQGSANAWTSGSKYATSNQQNLVDHTDNNFMLTGVQLEIGIATDFEHEEFTTTLAKCQRYYVKWTTASGTGMGGVCRSTSAGIVGGLNFPVAMRAAPTMTWGTFTCIDSSAGGVDATMSTNAAGAKGVTASFASASGLTDGNGAYLELKSGQTLQASAEL